VYFPYINEYLLLKIEHQKEAALRTVVLCAHWFSARLFQKQRINNAKRVAYDKKANLCKRHVHVMHKSESTTIAKTDCIAQRI
jgi:hypothetical protein